VAAQANTAIAEHFDAATLILGPSWERIQQFGALMARGAATVPKHLSGNVADCTAVAMMAIGWGMNPFAVAQKTHISQSGAIGYEAQLINAIIQASGVLDGDPDYEWFGDWSKVAGKCEERKSEKTGGKYYVSTYKTEDEKGLGIRVSARLRGETKPRVLEVLMAQAWPRFSTQWATDPKQQIAYLALRKFARLYKPGVILGVYTNDELEGPSERDMGAADVVIDPPNGPTAYPAADFEKNLPAWTAAIQKGKKVDDLIKMISSKGKGVLSDEQIATLRAIKVPVTIDQEPDKEPPTKPDKGTAPTVTFAAVSKKLDEAGGLDLLAAAADLIRLVESETERASLTALYTERKAVLEGGAK
jgi:hypothetical protein